MPSDAVLVTTEQVTTGLSELFGLAVLAGTLSALVAVLYRWYTREEVPTGLALLVGLAGVAVYLNTTSALQGVISGEIDPRDEALFNIVAFLFGTVGSLIGHRAGDHFGSDVILGESAEKVDDEIGRLVETIGRVITVDLPESIDDVVGYDPVPPQTKDELAGKRFVFPRKLTVEQLRERVVSRLKADYAIGTVDMELADDGSIEYLAVGSRAAGIGPTLPPATNAVAVRADPAFSASTGDLVQVWESDPLRRVLTAELRGVAEDVVTVAISSADTQKIDPTRQYRLVTLPVDDRPEREFASLLRVADETFSSVTVEAGSPLHGMPVGSLDITITAVKPEETEPVALPATAHVLTPGDVIFALAAPEELRKLETASQPLSPSIAGRKSSPAVDEPSTGEPTRTDAESRSEPVQSETPAEGDDASDGPDPHADANANEDSTDSGMASGGDASTFDELKEEYDSGEEWDEESESDHEPVEATAGGDLTETTDVDSDTSAGSSFDELKEEFESGAAEWDDDASADSDVDEEVAFDADSGDGAVSPADGTSPAAAGGDGSLDSEDAGSGPEDDLVSLEDADISFGDDADGEKDDEDDLSALDLEADEQDDDLSALAIEDDDEDGLLDEDGEAKEDEDESEDDDDSGGGTSFQQLKDEFESGDADWEDDVSDSPGGDMRLDE